MLYIRPRTSACLTGGITLYEEDDGGLAINDGDDTFLPLDDDSPPTIPPELALRRAKDILRPRYGDVADEHIHLLLYQLRRSTHISTSQPPPSSSLSDLRQQVYGSEEEPLLDDRERVIYDFHEYIQDNKLSDSQANDLLDLIYQIAEYQHVLLHLRLPKDLRTIKKQVATINAKVAQASLHLPNNPTASRPCRAIDEEDTRVVHQSFDIMEVVDHKRHPVVPIDPEASTIVQTRYGGI